MRGTAGAELLDDHRVCMEGTGAPSR